MREGWRDPVRRAAARLPSRTVLTTVGLLAAAACAASLPSAASASGKTVWLCRPGKQRNPCEVGLGTTLISPSGQPIGVRRPRAAKHPKVDCFYVYPTVSDQQTPNANLQIDPEERSIALYQAARYSQECRVFAPMYRQLTLAALFGGPVTDHMRRLAYSSALRAWRTYLRKYNHGRGVVLIGHSQGSFILRELIANEIDPHRAARRRLVSALLLGGNATVKDGRGVGGDFQHLRACRSGTQLHCVVAYSLFNAPVPPNAVFGRTSAPGLRILCTNPAALGGGTGRLDAVLPTKPFAPGTTIGIGTGMIGFPPVQVSTPWVEAKNAYTGRCSSANDASVLQVSDRPGAPHLNPVPDATWGLHLADANLPLGNLSRLVRKQAKAYVNRTGHRASSPSPR